MLQGSLACFPPLSRMTAEFTMSSVPSAFSVALTARHMRQQNISTIDLTGEEHQNPCKLHTSVLPPAMPHRFDESSLLWKWASHHDESFHDFTEEEATHIRQALLTWYHSTRRKLPWRGDPPPYDGSTAGINDKTKPAKSPGQISIKKFLAANSKSQEPETDKENRSDELPLSVTGYGVWVSEIMLQQTRVEAVIPYYLKWMKSFPTVYDLAKASEEDVNAHWAGLGFYRRARLLHAGAKLVVSKHGGELPRTVKELMSIKGIGMYTASAIASIAFNVCVPVVDGNVCRVFSRLRGIANHIQAPILKDKLVWRLAEQIVKAGDGRHAGDVNQALMELGATYCSPAGTGLDDRDPLKLFYTSTKLAGSFDLERKKLAQSGYAAFPVETYLEKAHPHKSCIMCADKASVLTQFSQAWNRGHFVHSHGPFPLTPPKVSERKDVLAIAVLKAKLDSGFKWLLVKRPKEGLLAGQWEFPSVCIWSSADEKQSGSKKRKNIAEELSVPIIEEHARSEALTKYLHDLVTIEKSLHQHTGSTDTSHMWIPTAKRHVLPGSEEYLFSHVRQTMWIEYATFSGESVMPTSWTSNHGQEVRWMSNQDMDKVGITSLVKKVLKKVGANLR